MWGGRGVLFCKQANSCNCWKVVRTLIANAESSIELIQKKWRIARCQRIIDLLRTRDYVSLGIISFCILSETFELRILGNKLLARKRIPKKKWHIHLHLHYHRYSCLEGHSRIWFCARRRERFSYFEVYFEEWGWYQGWKDSSVIGRTCMEWSRTSYFRNSFLLLFGV